MASLTTSFKGIELNTPLIVGASHLTGDLEIIKKIEQAGAGGVVVKSLFEEQLENERLEFEEDLTRYDDQHAEMVTLYPHEEYKGPERHLELVRKACENVSIPIFASLNAIHHPTWLDYSHRLSTTGIAGLELNFYPVPADPNRRGQEIVDAQIGIVKEVVSSVSIPVSVKLSPFYVNPCNIAQRLANSGVKGVVLFNNLFQPDIDILEEKSIFPLEFSTEKDSRLPLRFAGLLYGSLQADICCSTGIFQGADIIKMLLAGAACVQVISTIYTNGIDHINKMLRDVRSWMDAKGYGGLDDFRGRLSKKITCDPWVYERAQYAEMKMHSAKIINGRLQTH